MFDEPTELDVPIWSNEAEKSALGSAFLSERAADEIIDMLVEEDFFRVSHRYIFRAMVELRRKHHPIDFVSVKGKLLDFGLLADVGGDEALVACAEFVPSPANSDFYAAHVKAKATRRRLEEVGKETIRDAREATSEEEAIALLEGKIRKLSNAASRSNATSISNLCKEFAAEIDAYYESPKAIKGVRSGFYALDKKLAGHQPGDLVIIGARPGMGKTTLMVDMALNAARNLVRNDERGQILVQSLEMSGKQLIRRIASVVSGVSIFKMRLGIPLLEWEYEKLMDAMETVYQLPIVIDDSPGLTPTQLLARGSKIKSESGIVEIFVDYLGLMSIGRKVGSKTEEWDLIAKEIKHAARELDCPIVALAQLNRGVEQRENKRPTLSDLRDSGQIEANADVVMFLYRDSYYKAKEQQTEEETIVETEVIIAKHRNGEVGTVKLGFEPRFTRFRNLG